MTARRHHYIPQGYLAAFTDTGTKDGQLWVMELKSGNSFRTSPKNVGVARDFNRIDASGLPVDALESALAEFEADAITSIRKILNSRTFPDHEDLNIILNFICLIAVRNPFSRSSFNQTREQIFKSISNGLVSDRRIFESHQRNAAAAGHIPNTNVSFDDMKKFVEKGSYTVEFHPQGNSRIEFEVFDKLLPVLGERTWSLFIAPNNGPEFICSDHPVTLAWKGKHQGPAGYGLRQTEVFMPLSRTVGIYGTFEDPLPPVVSLNIDDVAAINTRSCRNAERHIFSCLNAFSIKHEGLLRIVECDTKNPSDKPHNSHN